MLLQSFDNFSQVAFFDPHSGVLTNRDVAESLEEFKPCGHYTTIEGKAMALYVSEGLLHLYINGAVFALTEDVKAELVRSAGQSMFLLMCELEPVMRILYQPEIIDPPLVYDPTPFAEEEDHDFLLFVHNVINVPERRQLYLERRKNCKC
jgi:hypothetical protein